MYCLQSLALQQIFPSPNAVFYFQLNMQEKYILYLRPVQLPLRSQYGGKIALSFIRLLHAIVDGMSVECVNNVMDYSLDHQSCLIVACMVNLFG